jgi:hypothetical protein
LAGIEFRRPGEPDIRIESFWFNVFYGGKPSAERTMGMTIDEVAVDSSRIGCDAGDGLTRTVSADITGDGFDDHLSWGRCVAGTCFQAATIDDSGGKVVRELGDGAWFNLDTLRLGIGSGDLNADGRDDIVYYGRCEGSKSCWRVHLSEGSSLSTPQDWGDGARFTPSTGALITGDWNGDGADDLVYQGLCGVEASSCWRAHINVHNGFRSEGWGEPPTEAMAAPPLGADLDGDGRDDLVYPGGCGEELCWYGQLSTGTTFAPRVNLGSAHPEELERPMLFDFDGDDDEDLIRIRTSDQGQDLTIRLAGPDGLGDPTKVAGFDRPVIDVVMRRLGPGRPVQALVTTECDGSPCVERYLTRAGRLLAEDLYRVTVSSPPVA